ncbi:hypothetical protein N0V88_006030 [Collariella sp. IMI 366227]|nr:hypothetical protein N0V88_006030 [Collariella sp. IMI 366227]
MATLRFDPEYQNATRATAKLTPPAAKDARSLHTINTAAIKTVMAAYPCPYLSQVREATSTYLSTDNTTPITLHRFDPIPEADYYDGDGIDIGNENGHGTSRSTPPDQHPIFAPATASPLPPLPSAHEDIYSALLHLHTHAAALNINPSRIALLGMSAGGLAAGVALRARDEGRDGLVGMGEEDGEDGGDVEVHVYPGVPHAWEWMAADAGVTRRAVENRVRALMDW